MNKIKMFCCVMLCFLLLPVYAEADTPRTAAGKQSSEQMAYLKLLLSQLRDAASSLKDIEDLTMVGMPEGEAAAMRHAMELKIQDMQKEALITIHSL